MGKSEVKVSPYLDTTNIKVGGFYGHYRVLKKIKKKWYGCECIACGEKWKYKAKHLLELPIHEGCLSKAKIEEILNEGNTEDEEWSESSTFKKDVPRILEFLKEFEDTNQASTFMAVSQLRMLIDLIPYAESSYRSYSSRPNADALAAMVTQVRETIGDLEASLQGNELMQEVAGEILYPTFRRVISAVAEIHYKFLERVKKHVPEHKWETLRNELGVITKATGAEVESIYSEATSQFSEKLG